MSQRPPALTDANDVRTLKNTRLLTPTDAHRRNYSPPEPTLYSNHPHHSAAQELDGRSWPDIARALGTKHQLLYHLSTGQGPKSRRCRQGLRDGFAELFEVLPEWLSGQTDALPYVLTADATVVSLPVFRKREVHSRVSILEGAGRDLPALQLALDRLLAQADNALARDLETVEGAAQESQIPRLFALLLVASSVEVGLDLIRPLPQIDEADALRVSAVRHGQEIYRPWLEGKGPYPEWKHIYERVLDQVPDDERVGMLIMLEDLVGAELYATYALTT